MAEETQAQEKQETGGQLEGGTYEIIRQRMLSHGKSLSNKITQLNTARKEIFGSIDFSLTGTERITTNNNCIPRDMVPLGEKFLFGYNVTMGLKSTTNLEDILAVYEYRDKNFHQQDLELLNNETFHFHFKDLFKYYKKTVFAKFMVKGSFLYMVFQIGKGVNDIKAFKWVINQDHSLQYVDDRSDHEVTFPAQHEFEWIRTRRDFHRTGEHPHISIEDRLFVETVGGDLTIKIEDNTESGTGIYEEDVVEKDQTLDDADIFYASLGNLIILKIRPYLEKQFRYIVYNEKMQEAVRIDAIEDSCILLPEDDGIIFSNGYYLQTGEYKLFDNAFLCDK